MSGAKTDDLAEITRLGMPAILLACKSDPGQPPQVDPGYANSIGHPHNIGLIEVTMETPEGRSKMRNGVRWLIFKLEQRIRESSVHPEAGHSDPG